MATTRTAQVTLAKDPDTGKPVATIYTASDVTLADIGVLQGKLFGEVFKANGKALGLKFCEGCRSGLDKLLIKDIATLPGKQLAIKVKF
ncbi:MAG: hypothetical protein NTW28_18475 [Candidatus Solibacter sp.]|nr:hypothetical protein [Candidatus Solibacter sp.]